MFLLIVWVMTKTAGRMDEWVGGWADGWLRKLREVTSEHVVERGHLLSTPFSFACSVPFTKPYGVLCIVKLMPPLHHRHSLHFTRSQAPSLLPHAFHPLPLFCSPLTPSPSLPPPPSLPPSLPLPPFLPLSLPPSLPPSLSPPPSSSQVKESDLRSLLGDDWVRQQASEVQRHAAEYLRLSFAKLPAVLRMDNLPSSHRRTAVKVRALTEGEGGELGAPHARSAWAGHPPRAQGRRAEGDSRCKTKRQSVRQILSLQ